MKKTIAILLVLLMILGITPVFAGCDETPAQGTPETDTTESGKEETPGTAQEPEEPGTSEENPKTSPEEPETPGENPETPEPETPSVPSSFRACSIETTSLGTFRYWLYTPSDPTENMPLIVYLHGGRGRGDNLELITSVDGFPKYLRDGTLGDVRAYVIIPQLPETQKGWANGAAAVYSLIQVTVSRFGIDRGNISLTGHSMGGTGAWNLALAYPTLFARVAPLSGSIRNLPEYVEKLKNTPVRAFVGSADTVVLPDTSIAFVAALKSAGGDADITVFDGAVHENIPALTYLDRDIGLIDWLIQKAG